MSWAFAVLISLFLFICEYTQLYSEAPLAVQRYSSVAVITV